MEHKLIKIENEYYLTTEAKVVEGEYGLAFAHGGRNGFGRGWYIFYHDGRPVNKLNAICAGSRKITHSTAPIDGDEVGSCFNTIKQLSLKNCQAIECCVDLDTLVLSFYPKTEWDVEIIMGDPIGIGDKYTPDTKPKLDADGCLVLKRK